MPTVAAEAPCSVGKRTRGDGIDRAAAGESFAESFPPDFQTGAPQPQEWSERMSNVERTRLADRLRTRENSDPKSRSKSNPQNHNENFYQGDADITMMG